MPPFPCFAIRRGAGVHGLRSAVDGAGQRHGAEGGCVGGGETSPPPPALQGVTQGVPR
jgi:hypothetical protein